MEVRCIPHKQEYNDIVYVRFMGDAIVRRLFEINQPQAHLTIIHEFTFTAKFDYIRTIESHQICHYIEFIANFNLT